MRKSVFKYGNTTHITPLLSRLEKLEDVYTKWYEYLDMRHIKYPVQKKRQDRF
jgi:hypothetical protein